MHKCENSRELRKRRQYLQGARDSSNGRPQRRTDPYIIIAVVRRQDKCRQQEANMSGAHTYSPCGGIAFVKHLTCSKCTGLNVYLELQTVLRQIYVLKTRYRCALSLLTRSVGAWCRWGKLYMNPGYTSQYKIIMPLGCVYVCRLRERVGQKTSLMIAYATCVDRGSYSTHTGWKLVGGKGPTLYYCKLSWPRVTDVTRIEAGRGVKGVASSI